MISDLQINEGVAPRDTGIKSAVTWSTTGFAINFLERVLDMNIEVKGLDKLTSAPTLYVVNHFTRIETFILPYLLHKYRKDMPRCLAHHSLFVGTLGRFISRLGAVSTKEPFRNRMIIGDLITGRKNWVIYPEGVMVKSKKFIERKGGYLIDSPQSSIPPRTGAAMLALKAALYREDYLKAYRNGDVEKMAFYQDRYLFESPEEVSSQRITITPVNITYYPIRPGDNVASRLAEKLFNDLPENLEEELKTEGRLLLGKTDMTVTFKSTMDVLEHAAPVGWLSKLTRPFMKSEQKIAHAIDRCRGPLTYQFMKSVYSGVTLNFDHLFCKGLELVKSNAVERNDFLKALFLTATELSQIESIDQHPSLAKASAIVAHLPYEPLDSIERQALSEGIITRTGNRYNLNRHLLEAPLSFHDARLQRASKVIANEVEPISECIEALRKNLSLSSKTLRSSVGQQLKLAEQKAFESEYDRSYDPDLSKPKEIGEPFQLKSESSEAGILFVHGYLAAPMEMRALADEIHLNRYDAYGVRLKGHGTSPKELENVELDDWIESLSHGYAILENTFDTVYAVGFSMGATLSLIKAAHLGERLKGLVIINPALKLRDSRIHLVGPTAAYNEIVSRMGMEKAQLRYLRNDSINPHINYKLNYLKGMQQFTRACSACEKILPDVRCPTLILQSTNDPIVDPRSAEIIESAIGSAFKKRVMIESDAHSIVSDDSQSKVASEILNFFACLKTPMRLEKSAHRN